MLDTLEALSEAELDMEGGINWWDVGGGTIIAVGAIPEIVASDGLSFYWSSAQYEYGVGLVGHGLGMW